MKKVVNSLSALVLFLTLAGVFAFNLVNEPVDTIYWFEYDGVNIGSYMGNTPDVVCSESSGEACALGFQEADVDESGPEPVLESGVTSGDAIDDAFKL